MSVETVVLACLAEVLSIEEDDISKSDLIYDDIGADSLDAVEFIMAIEEEFDIDIEDSSGFMHEDMTVQDVITYIENLVE